MPVSPVYRGARASVTMDDVTADDVTATATDNIQDIVSALTLVREAVHHLVSLYCLSLYPGYLPQWWVEPQVILHFLNPVYKNIVM